MQSADDTAAIARRFDERADDYDDSAFHQAFAAAAVQFAGTHGVRSVLDVATGTALVLRALPRSGIRMTGVDVSTGMLAVARRRLPEADLVLGDASDTSSFRGASFDLITCVTALHLLPAPADALRSWRGLLSDQGRIVVGVFRTDDAAEVPEVAAALARGGERRPHGEHDELHARVGTQPALRKLAAGSGLLVNRVRTWVYPEPLEVCLLAELIPRRDGARDA